MNGDLYCIGEGLDVSQLPPIAAVALGAFHGLFLAGTPKAPFLSLFAVTGELLSAGSNTDGQLGTGQDVTGKSSFHRVALPEETKNQTVIAVAAGAHHSLCLLGFFIFKKAINLSFQRTGQCTHGDGRTRVG